MTLCHCAQLGGWLPANGWAQGRRTDTKTFCVLIVVWKMTCGPRKICRVFTVYRIAHKFVVRLAILRPKARKDTHAFRPMVPIHSEKNSSITNRPMENSQTDKNSKMS